MKDINKEELELIPPESLSDRVHIFVMQNFFLKAVVINNDDSSTKN